MFIYIASSLKNKEIGYHLRKSQTYDINGYGKYILPPYPFKLNQFKNCVTIPHERI